MKSASEISKPKSRSALQLIAALSVLTTCGACAQSVAVQAPRQLPAAPDFARPVSVPEPREGESAIVIAARERAGRQRANGIIRGVVTWYEQVRSSYGEPKT